MAHQAHHVVNPYKQAVPLDFWVGRPDARLFPYRIWQALLTKSASANEINMRNGALIDVHLRYTQQSLDALRNINGVGVATTYDAHGRGARGTPGRKPIVAG